MAGYTRQSAPDIINGAEVTAPPLIAEFNQIQSAFDGTSGHSHDGSTGNSPKINLGTSVSNYLLPANGGVGGLNNTIATTNPQITDDVNSGYAPGSIWLNTSTSRFFICRVNTASAAQWSEVVGVTSNSITPEITNTVDIGSSSHKYKDFHLAGNALVGGTLGVTGLSTLADLNSTTSTLGSVTVGGAGTHGSINGVVIGSTNPTSIAGTTVSASSGFTGDLSGNVAGNVTASSGTSSFDNATVSGTLTASLSGNVAGNVTSTGTSTFNDVTINGTLNMDAGTTGTIQNLSAPVNPNDAARKVDVDTAVSDLVASSPAALDTLNELAAAINDDANFSTTITNSIATKLPLAGGTMTGAIDMGSQKITTTYAPINTPDLTNKSYVDTQDALKLNLSGGTMSGTIAMSNNTISGLPNPTQNDEVSTKAYTDAILGSATSAATSATAAANSAAAALASENFVSANATAINTVSGSISSVNTVATDISNVNSLASVLTGSTTYTVTVANVGGVNVFVLDGVNNPTLSLVRGNTYIFDLSDSSNSGHPLAFKDGSGNSYTSGVTVTGTAGSSGAKVTFAVPSNAPASLRYYCTVHGNAMGNTITASSNNLSVVAGSISNVNLTGGSIANVNLVGGSITNLNTVASNLSSINDFADKYRIGSSDPSSSNDEGDLFYNTTTNILKVYNGTAWEAGVTAGSGFLALTGGELTGNLTFSGTQTVDGRDVSADGTKLDGIETGATADQTAAEIRTLVEAATDSNVFTDADHTKLDNVPANLQNQLDAKASTGKAIAMAMVFG